MDSIETHNLLLRPFTLEDDVDLYKIMGDDPDMTWEGEPWSIETNRKWLGIRLKHYQEHGFGVLAIIDKKSGDMIGQSGLQFLEKTDDVEIVTYIAKHLWQKGVGFEASSASLIYGFKKLKLPKIVAVTRMHNVGGQRLAEKLGFKYIGEGLAYGVTALFYRLLSSEFTTKLRYPNIVSN
jgi:RimJ/RimL family protein N-acetyltransferase